MLTVIEKLQPSAPLAGDKAKKDAAAPVSTAVADIELQFPKESCKMFIELCSATWLEDKCIEEFWEKIPKTRTSDGKDSDTVGKKALKDFVLERTFEKLCIKISRFEQALETAPVKQNFLNYTEKLVDFLQNGFCSDVTLVNPRTCATYK